MRVTPLPAHSAPRSRAKKWRVVEGSMLRKYAEAQALTPPWALANATAPGGKSTPAWLEAAPVSRSPAGCCDEVLAAMTSGTSKVPPACSSEGSKLSYRSARACSLLSCYFIIADCDVVPDATLRLSVAVLGLEPSLRSTPFEAAIRLLGTAAATSYSARAILPCLSYTFAELSLDPPGRPWATRTFGYFEPECCSASCCLPRAFIACIESASDVPAKLETLRSPRLDGIEPCCWDSDPPVPGRN